MAEFEGESDHSAVEGPDSEQETSDVEHTNFVCFFFASIFFNFNVF